MACADVFKRHMYGMNDQEISLAHRFVAGAFGGICGQVCEKCAFLQ